MGYSDFVELQLTVKEAGQVQAWLEAKKGPEQMGDAMDKMGRKGKQSSDTLGGAMDSLATKWTSIISLQSLAQRGLEFYMEANKKAIQEGKSATQLIDTEIRRAMVQGAGGLSQAQLTQLVGNSAIKAAVSTQFAARAGTQATSSGFNAQDIYQGGGLDSFLEFANATNSTDQDPAQLMKSIGLFLGATGQDLNAANMRRTMVGVQRLFKGTNMQASALPFLAREGSQITDFGQLTGDDTLALSSVLLNTLGEEKAATAFRGTVTDLATLGKDKNKVQGLSRMGLKPEDVDMVGESFTDALERINTAANKLDPATRNVVMSQIFRQESLPGVMALMSDKGRNQFTTNRALMGDEAGFLADVGIATTGEAAEIRRNETAETLADYASGRGEVAIAIDTARRKSKEAKRAPVRTAIEENAAVAASGLGLSGDQSVQAGGLAADAASGAWGAMTSPWNPMGLAYQTNKMLLEIVLKDEDNRAIPHEQRGKGVEEMGR